MATTRFLVNAIFVVLCTVAGWSKGDEQATVAATPPPVYGCVSVGDIDTDKTVLNLPDKCARILVIFLPENVTSSRALVPITSKNDCVINIMSSVPTSAAASVIVAARRVDAVFAPDKNSTHRALAAGMVALVSQRFAAAAAAASCAKLKIPALYTTEEAKIHDLTIFNKAVRHVTPRYVSPMLIVPNVNITIPQECKWDFTTTTASVSTYAEASAYLYKVAETVSIKRGNEGWTHHHTSAEWLLCRDDDNRVTAAAAAPLPPSPSPSPSRTAKQECVVAMRLMTDAGAWIMNRCVHWAVIVSAIIYKGVVFLYTLLCQVPPQILLISSLTFIVVTLGTVLTFMCVKNMHGKSSRPYATIFNEPSLLLRPTQDNLKENVLILRQKEGAGSADPIDGEDDINENDYNPSKTI